jgi:hypothetical protein
MVLVPPISIPIKARSGIGYYLAETMPWQFAISTLQNLRSLVRKTAASVRLLFKIVQKAINCVSETADFGSCGCALNFGARRSRRFNTASQTGAEAGPNLGLAFLQTCAPIHLKS